MQETKKHDEISESQKSEEHIYSNKSRLVSVLIIILAVLAAVVIVVAGIKKENGEKFPFTEEGQLAATASPEANMTTVTPAPEATPSVPSENPDSGSASADLTKSLIAGKSGADEKIAYLTFDDGPSENTLIILDALRQYDAKATFFVTGEAIKKHPEIIKRLYDEGHSVGNHSYSHDYDSVYSSPEQFVDEIKKNEKLIGDIIGSENVLKLFRFPGGSFGEKRKPFRETIVSTGYKYVDWNALNSDADGQEFSAERCLSEVKKYCTDTGNVIILMHDAATKNITAETLPQVLEYLVSQNYTFERIVP